MKKNDLEEFKKFHIEKCSECKLKLHLGTEIGCYEIRKLDEIINKFK